MKILVKSVSAIFILILSLSFNSVAQDNSTCDADFINSSISELMDIYNSRMESFESVEDAIEAANELNSGVEAIIKQCEGSLARGNTANVDPGRGTLAEPFAFNFPGDTGEGFTIKVDTFLADANQQVRNENMFNDRPNADQKYVLVGVEISCLQGGTSSCETNYFDYYLVGDNGVVYEHPYIVFDDELDVNIFPGASSKGFLPFLVSKDDENLKLLYRANMFQDEIVVYSAQPSLDNGIEVSASKSINIRSNPGTNQTVVGSMPPGTTEIAFGRNSDGTWLQITMGWVFADLVEVSGDVMSLPVTSQ